MYFQSLSATTHGFFRPYSHKVAFYGSGKRRRVVAFAREYAVQFLHQSRISPAVTVTAFDELIDANVFPLFSKNAHFDYIFLFVENNFAISSEKSHNPSAILRKRHHRQRGIDSVRKGHRNMLMIDYIVVTGKYASAVVPRFQGLEYFFFRQRKILRENIDRPNIFGTPCPLPRFNIILYGRIRARLFISAIRTTLCGSFRRVFLLKKVSAPTEETVSQADFAYH